MNEDDWLLTMDVMSLYTNIPHDEGIKNIQDLLNSNKTESVAYKCQFY